MATTNILNSLGASDIDTKELTANLVKATSGPRQKLIDEQKKKLELQISSTALLKNGLAALQAAATDVGSVSSLNQLKIDSSDPTVLSAVKSSQAVASVGSYSVTVTRLATPQRTLIALPNPLPNGYTMSGDDTITLSRGDPDVPESYSELEITFPNGSTPSQIVDLVNSSARSFGVKATLIDTKSGDKPLKIVLESATGKANEFSFASLKGVLPLEVLETAQNSIIDVNGLTFERSSNEISDAVSGLTLQLNAASVPGKAVRLAVNSDTPAVIDKVKNLVDTYNIIREFLVKATGPKINGDDIAGSLQNNSAARAILVRLRSTVTSEFKEKPSAVTHWSTLGVSFSRDGTLEFDSKKFQTGFENNRKAAITALTNDSSAPYVYANLPSGLAGDIAVAAYQLIRSTGSVTAMVSSNETGLKQVERKQTELDAYVERITAQYEKQFTAMSAALANFKNTQSQLTRAFSTKSDDG